MGFAGAVLAQQHDVLAPGDVAALGIVANLDRIEHRPLLQIGGLQGLEQRKPGFPQPALDLIGLPLLQLAAGQSQ